MEETVEHALNQIEEMNYDAQLLHVDSKKKKSDIMDLHLKERRF